MIDQTKKAFSGGGSVTSESQPAWLDNWQRQCREQAVEIATVRPGSPRWVKGMPSPNPKGRPPGIAERKAKVTERMLDQAGAVIDVMLAKALEGDAAAAALVINRVLPVLRPQSEKVQFTLHADQPVSRQVEQVLTAIAKGEVAPDVGKKIVEVVQALSNTRAVEDLEQRINLLEGKAA